MTESWNFQTSAYQRLKWNFRVLHLTPIFFRTDVLHQDKKRWKQVKHHWFDIIQPIRPDLRWKIFTISCKNVTMLFSMWQEKFENFHGMKCFFLHCHPISYFIIHVCNQKIDKHSKMTESWNFQTSAYQRLKWNFRVLDLIPIFFRTDVLHQDKKRWKQVKHHWFDIIQPIRPDLRWKFFTIGCKNVTMLFSMWQERLKIFMEWNVFPSLPSYFLFHNTCLQSKNR